MNNLPRLQSNDIFRSFAPRGTASRRPHILLAMPLALTFVTGNVCAEVVKYQDTLRQGADLASGLSGVTALAMDPDGARLYTAAAADSALGVFARNGSGGLAPDMVLQDDGSGGAIDGLAVATDVAVSPDGMHVYAVSLGDNALSVYGRTAQGLAHVETLRDGVAGVAGLKFPNRIAVSPDGSHVYVATRDTTGPDSVFAFHVIDAEGRLALVARYQQGDVAGIGDVTGLIVSPDGGHVYLSGSADHGVIVFARNTDDTDPGYGTLNWTASYLDGADGVDGLNSAADLVLDPTGRYLYVAGSGEDAVAAFARDETDGLLTPLAVYRNGQDGITGLGAPFALAASPDGGRLYVAGTAENALVVLRRDPVTGLLSYLESHHNGDGGNIAGLDRVLALATSPDGAHLYTASPLAAEVGIFALASADLELTLSPETGGDAAYRLGISNHGPVDATHIRLTDLLAAGADVMDLEAPAGATCTRDIGAVVCEIGVLAAGATAELRLTLLAPGAHAASVYADQRDPDVANNTAGIEEGGNSVPVAVADDARTTPGASIDIDVLSNDSDPDGDALAVSGHDAGSLFGGTITLNPAGTLRYTPAAGFTGVDSFSYTVTDGIATASAAVTVRVNTPPTARDDSATTTAGTTIQILVLSNDSDADSDALVIAGVDAVSAAGGTIVSTGDAISYTPPAGYTGGDSFTYTVTDGEDTGGATVTVTVQPIGSGVSVDPPTGDDDAGRRGGGGGMDPLFCLALLPWALARRRGRGAISRGRS